MLRDEITAALKNVVKAIDESGITRVLESVFKHDGKENPSEILESFGKYIRASAPFKDREKEPPRL